MGTTGTALLGLECLALATAPSFYEDVADLLHCNDASYRVSEPGSLQACMARALVPGKAHALLEEGESENLAISAGGIMNISAAELATTSVDPTLAGDGVVYHRGATK